MKKIRNRKDLKVIDLLIAHGPAGYGVYVMLTEYLGERKSLRRREDIPRIAYELHAPAEMVRSVLEDFGLFVCIDEEFFNESMPPKTKKHSDEKVDEKVEEVPALLEDKPEEAIICVIPKKIPSKRSVKRKVSVKKLLHGSKNIHATIKPLPDIGVKLGI